MKLRMLFEAKLTDEYFADLDKRIRIDKQNIVEIAKDIGKLPVTIHGNITSGIKLGKLSPDIREAMKQNTMLSDEYYANMDKLVRQGHTLPTVAKIMGQNYDGVRGNFYRGLKNGKLSPDLKEIARQNGNRARSEASAERWADPEYKEKVSQSVRDAWTDPDLLARQSELKQKQWDAEARARRSEYLSDPEVKEKQSQALKKYYREHPEAREMQGKRLAAIKQTPEFKEKQEAARRKYWEENDFWDLLAQYPLEKGMQIIAAMTGRQKDAGADEVDTNLKFRKMVNKLKAIKGEN